MLVGTLINLIGFFGFCLSESLPLLTLSIFTFSVGQTALWTMAAPFMADNSQPHERTQLFSLQFALETLTNFIGNIGGGFLPRLYGNLLGTAPESTEALRVTLLTAAVFAVLSFVPLFFLTEKARPLVRVKANQKTRRKILPNNIGLIIWLVMPEVLIGLGAGMTIPFLNVYVSGKFGVDFEALGLLFGFAELSTTLAIFIQPILARRYGKVRSVVLFQGLSLPFLVMLGFGPYFWMVAIALYIRGALMQAANPVYQVFVQEQVPEDERATASAVLSVTDSLARGSGSAFSGFLRGAIGSTAGFNVLFGLMITLYISSISLFYLKFRHKDLEVPPEPSPSQEASLTR